MKGEITRCLMDKSRRSFIPDSELHIPRKCQMQSILKELGYTKRLYSCGGRATRRKRITCRNCGRWYHRMKGTCKWSSGCDKIAISGTEFCDHHTCRRCKFDPTYHNSGVVIVAVRRMGITLPKNVWKLIFSMAKRMYFLTTRVHYGIPTKMAEFAEKHPKSLNYEYTYDGWRMQTTPHNRCPRASMISLCTRGCGNYAIRVEENTKPICDKCIP